jgi:hypothetical protein
MLAGKVVRDAQFAAQALELNGEFGRDVRAEVSAPGTTTFFMSPTTNAPPAIPSGLRIGRDAKITGALTYISPADQSASFMAQPLGGVNFTLREVTAPEVPRAPFAPYEGLLTRVRDFFTVLLIGLLALWLAPKYVSRAVENARTKPLACTAWGLFVLVAGYVLALVVFAALLMLGIVLALTTLGGLSITAFVAAFAGLGLVVTGFTGVVLWGAKVIVACLIGKLLLQRLAHGYADNNIFAFVLGLLLFELVAAIPILGFAVTVVTILLGLGALWYLVYPRKTTLQAPLVNPMPLPA